MLKTPITVATHPVKVETGHLSTKDKIRYALWTEWSSKSYLDTYFSKLGPDSHENLKFLVRELQVFKGKPKRKILDFGAGPTIFTALAVLPYASEIHITDYLVDNLLEVNKWLRNDPDAFDWSLCTKEILELEGIIPDKKTVELREKALRSTKTQISLCDASLPLPLKNNEKYPIVISNFCADSATASKDICKVYMKNIVSLVAKNGTLLLSALRNCSFYRIKNMQFPCANINEGDLITILLECGFKLKNIQVDICNIPECAPEGFTSMMFARAIK